MKIILVVPPVEKVLQSKDSGYPTLGIGYLAASLEKAGHEVQVLDGKVAGFNSDQCVDWIEKFDPGFIGMTAMTHQISDGAQLALKLKQRLPDKKIILGGPHAAAVPNETLDQFPQFDWICHGEGEELILEIVEVIRGQREIGSVKGLCFRQGEDIVNTGNRDAIQDLDSLPTPAWHLWTHKLPYYAIFGSRGCPYRCNFCMRVLGSKARIRDAQAIVDEIEMLVTEYDVKRFDFEDEVFGLKKSQAFELCEEMVKRGLHEKVRWGANLTARVNRDLLEAMHRAGCGWVAIGIESGDPEILKASGKGITLDQVEGVLKDCREIGIRSHGLYILGHPHETFWSALRTIHTAGKFNTYSVSFGIMVPYPGTLVGELAKRGEGGYKLKSENWADFDKYLGDALEFENISRRQLEVLQIYAYLYFYLRNFRMRELFRFISRHSLAAKNILKKVAVPKLLKRQKAQMMIQPKTGLAAGESGAY